MDRGAKPIAAERERDYRQIEKIRKEPVRYKPNKDKRDEIREVWRRTRSRQREQKVTTSRDENEWRSAIVDKRERR